MNKYRLNGLDDAWIFEADSEEEATAGYIKQCCGASTIEEFEKYCEDIDIIPYISWTQLN